MTKEECRVAIYGGATNTNSSFITVERPHLMKALGGSTPLDGEQAEARAALLELESKTPGVMYLECPRLLLVKALAAPVPDDVPDDENAD